MVQPGIVAKVTQSVDPVQPPQNDMTSNGTYRGRFNEWRRSCVIPAGFEVVMGPMTKSLTIERRRLVLQGQVYDSFYQV